MSPQVPLGRHPEPEFSWVTFLLHQAYPTMGQAQQQLQRFVTDANVYWFKEYMALTNTAGINRQRPKSTFLAVSAPHQVLPPCLRF